MPASLFRGFCGLAGAMRTLVLARGMGGPWACGSGCLGDPPIISAQHVSPLLARRLPNQHESREGGAISSRETPGLPISAHRRVVVVSFAFWLFGKGIKLVLVV